MKKNIYWFLSLFVTLVLGIVLGGYATRFFSPKILAPNSGRAKLEKLIDLIEKEYVDQVNTDSIIDNTVNNILSQLDPHSTYITKAELDEVANNMRGAFVGIGVNYYMLNDTLAIVKALEGGPSQKVGLTSGDRILSVNGKNIFSKNLSNDSIVNLLKGAAGTSVDLKIYRPISKKVFEVKVTRGDVPLKSVDVALKINDTLGYIKINRFAETTYTEFNQALSLLVRSKVKSLILDLRDNSGGYMEPAIQIADEFLDKGDIIVKTINKQGKVKITIASSNGLFTKGSLFVLINENTASASEIIAGALQDNDRAKIVGRRSYGKGLVQREMLLGDGSAVRLTTARYYTPSGRSIQKPYSDGVEAYSNELNTRFTNGELYERDSIHLADSLKFKTKKGRIVFGGGGIVPDVFVPLSNQHGEDAIQLLMNTSLVSYYVFEEIEKERAFLQSKNYKEVATIIYKNPKYFNNLKKYLKANGLTFNLDKHKDRMIYFLAAEYINQLYTPREYYAWLIAKDDMVEKLKKSPRRR